MPNISACREKYRIASRKKFATRHSALRTGLLKATTPTENSAASPATLRNLVVEEKDAEFIRAVYQAYSIADRGTKESFASVCEKILRMTIEYCRGRQTFGKPLIENQWIYFKLTELLSEVGADLDTKAFLANESTPTFFGSALTNFGVDLFLDAMLELAPPPSPGRPSRWICWA